MSEIYILSILIIAIIFLGFFGVIYCYWQWRHGRLKKSDIIIILIVLSLLALGPRVLHDKLPKAWGVAEATLKRDLTGFAFSSFLGEGSCRAYNTMATLHKGNHARIVLGYVSIDDEELPHLWGVDQQGIIDVVYKNSSKRRVLAVVNPFTYKIEMSLAHTPKESASIEKAVKYLHGFVPTVLRRKV